MYYLDVKETYFQGYRDCLDTVLKDPKGCICNYTEMKKECVYCKPFYDEKDNDRLDLDAKKFIFSSQRDWEIVKKQLQAIGRTGVRVSYYFIKILEYKILYNLEFV